MAEAGRHGVEVTGVAAIEGRKGAEREERIAVLRERTEAIVARLEVEEDEPPA